MKHKNIIATIIASAVFVALLFYFNNAREARPNTNINNTNPPVARPVFIDSGLANEMVSYHNTRLGFSMLLPQLASIGPNKLMLEVPVKVFDDGKSEVVFVDTEKTFLDETGNYNLDFGDLEAWKNPYTNSYKRLSKHAYAWKITIRSVKDFDELKSVVREVMGRTCVVKTTESSLVKKGTMSILLDETLTTDDSECAVGMYRIKYSSEKGKVAMWSIGQAYNFAQVSENGLMVKRFDVDMANSFVF